MQRQRRRDLNLKINRVLDKRSSRGMIYENEELRLRTMAIADDVDRGQNDIKKLRKENDHLKREIWSLRDECEKLEDILKKVVAAGGVPLDDPNDLPYPELFLDDGASFDEGEGSQEDDEHMAHLRNMFMIDEDGMSNTGSVVENFDNSSTKNSPEIISAEPKFGVYPSHPWGPAAIPPDLEPVREETESIVTSVTSVNNTISNSPVDFIGFEEVASLAVSQDNPLIQITPASSPASYPLDPDAPQSPLNSISPDCDMPSDSIQDGGCVADIPKMFQVTSQIQFDNSEDDLTSEYKGHPQTSVPLKTLPPPSPSSHHNPRQSLGNRRRLGKESDSTSTFSTESTSSRPHSVSGDNPSKENGGKNQSMSRRMYLSNRRNSQIISTSKNPFSGSMAFIVNRCCPNLHECYQSDPSSLATPTGNGDDNFCSSRLALDAPTGFCYPFNCQADKSSWNSIIATNLVVGYFKGTPGPVKIKPQDIIDELEVKVDSSLEKVKGIRMLPGRVFISFKDPSCVKYILQKFGSDSANSEQTQFLVKGQRVVFLDGEQKYSEVSLTGIPPDVSDLVVTSVLNQYGQVVAPLERRNYKGVDISERFARMHLVKSLPNVLSIGGYEVGLSVLLLPNNDDDECQDEVDLASPPPVPVNSSAVNVTPQDVLVNVETTHRPPLGTSVSNFKQVPSTSISSSDNLVTCHSSPVMSARVPNTARTHQNMTNSLTPSVINAHATITTPSLHEPNSMDGLKPHKQVIRSTSSNPRLETGGPAPLSPVASKRQSSVCTGNIPQEEHPNKMTTVPTQPINPKSLKVNGSTNSAPNLMPNPKKPLSRLLRSSPGSLVPPPSAANIMAGGKLVEAHDPTGSSSSPQGPAVPMNATGLRAAFYKSLSIDPRRRGSMLSQTGENNNIDKLGIYSRRGSRNVFQGGHHQGHPLLTQMNSASSSQFESRDSVVRGFGGNGSKEPLPWCGCWGNGCI